MEVLRDSTAVADSATIPGPYVSPERTESIPLKGTSPSSSSFLSRCCRNCLGFADDDASDGLKFIVVTFFILSAAVTVALFAQIYHGDYQVVPHGRVATDNIECSEIGINILKKNGNAVDAAVASTICMGVVNPHITGLGGGGFMLVYDHRRSEVLESLDFREAAPQQLHLPISGNIGPSTVAVPGLLRGLFAAQQAHGKLSWKEVVEPAAAIARTGFLVPSNLVAARDQLAPHSEFNAMLHNLMDSLEAGQSLKSPSLAATLDIVANEGPDAFYNGSIANQVLSAAQGSSVTLKDLSSYRPVQREPLHGNFAGYNIIVPGAPSGGPLLLAALDSISALNLSHIAAEERSPLLLYRLAQSIRQNYAGFYAESGDPDFSSASGSAAVPPSLPETVSSHVAAVDLNDLYVSVVSGHNSLFGSQILTEAGFILNNALASFDASSSSDNPSTANPTFANAYPLSNDPNSTVTFSRVAKLPDGSILIDHPAALTSPSSDQSHPLQVGHFDKNPSEETLFLKRNKRFDTPESGPRAAIWGSSVANNGLVGGKRPISLSTPIIAVEMGQICGRRLVLGGSDAGVAAQVLSQLLVLDGNITSSVDAPRVKLSSSGSTLSLEHEYAALLSPARQDQLVGLGVLMQPPTALNPSVNIIEKVGDTLSSHSDPRGEGFARGF